MASVAEVRASLDVAIGEIEEAQRMMHVMKDKVQNAATQINMVRQGSVDPIGSANLAQMEQLLDEFAVQAAMAKEAAKTYSAGL